MTITMVGVLRDCILLNYRTPAASVQHLLPAGLGLTTRGDWAFWNIVACRVDCVRPVGFPAWCGASYTHIAYRLLAQAELVDSEVLDGLFFVRSEADNRFIVWSGNALSNFRFHTAPIDLQYSDELIELNVSGSRDGLGDVRFVARPNGEEKLQAGSCFAAYHEATSSLEYRPLGIAPDRSGSQLALAEVFRDESKWRETPIEVVEARWSLFDALKQHDAHLELATKVEPIDYRWRLGRRIGLRNAECRLRNGKAAAECR